MQAAAAPATPGRLLVRSTPAGAVVTIDGMRRGTTPLALRDMAIGTYTVQVSREGFQPVERRVSLSSDQPSGSLALTLAPVRSRAAAAPTASAGLGSIAVLSRPAGATVYLDERPIGKTPLSVAEIAAGSHAVRLELAGHRRWATTVTVVSGERVRVAASLESGDY